MVFLQVTWLPSACTSTSNSHSSRCWPPCICWQMSLASPTTWTNYFSSGMFHSVHWSGRCVEHTTEFCTYFSYNVVIQLLYINVVVHYLQLRDCLTSLEGLTNDEGQYLAMFTTAMDPNGEFKGMVSQTQRCCGDRVEQPAQFEEVWAQLLTAIRENLEARFPDVEVLDAMQVIRGLRTVLPSIKL